MKKPLVTVFIPIYNCEKYLKECLDSIINQTYKNLDILLIDDGSTDNSLNIIGKYNDDRIRIIKNKENMGIPFVRNIGLNEAKGKYLAIMDSDDIALLNRIEEQVKFLELNEHIDGIGSYYKIIGRKINRNVKLTSDLEEIKIGLIFANQIGNPTGMIRMDRIRALGLHYNNKYFVAQDYDFWFQLSKVGNITIIPKVLLKYRVGHGNISKTSKVKKSNERKKILDLIHNDILDYYEFEFTDAEKKLFNNLFSDNSQNDFVYNNKFEIKEMIEKMIYINNKKSIFNEYKFNKIIKKYIFSSISIQKINLNKKIDLINLLLKRDIKYIIKIIIKDFYYKIILN